MQEFDHVCPKAFISGKIDLIEVSGRIIRINSLSGAEWFNNILNKKMDFYIKEIIEYYIKRSLWLVDY